jgi:hypothetical protein
MHLVSDFDDTLTNTTKYWNFWLEKLVGIGIDRNKAIDVGARLFVKGFTLQRHMELLGVSDSIAHPLMNEMMGHVKELGKDYVFPDVPMFLSQHHKSHSFSLLTYGDEGNQLWRVAESGIASFFSPVRIAGPDKHKVEHLKDVLKMETRVIFVDDSPNELNPVVDAGLPIKLYRIVRSGAKHDYPHERDDVAWKRISSFDQIVF